MVVDFAIIGGTGIAPRFEELGGRPVHIPTEYGMLRGSFIEYQGLKLFLVLRHAKGHKLPPHKINFQAMAVGLKKLNPKACFSTCAVGSARKDWPAGTLAICSDFLDYSHRNITIFEKRVQHRDMTEPYSKEFSEALVLSAQELQIPIHSKCVYICCNGPRYETPKEVELYGSMGGDVMGMTGATEAIVMREAGIPYASIALVTNLGTGLEDKLLDHSEVVDEMNKMGQKAVDLILKTMTKYKQ